MAGEGRGEEEGMTRDELLQELDRLRRKGKHDPEAAHELADAALLAFIDDLEVRDAFELVPKWYA